MPRFLAVTSGLAAALAASTATAQAAGPLAGSGARFETETGYSFTRLTPEGLVSTNRSGVQVNAAFPGDLYFVSRGSEPRGLPNDQSGAFRSEDRGLTWERVDPAVGRLYNYQDGLEVSPVDPNVLYVAEERNNRLSVSRDRGRSFQPTAADPLTVPRNLISLGLDPVNPDRLWVGGDQGLFVSNDGGASFEPAGSGELPFGQTSANFQLTSSVTVSPNVSPDGEVTLYASFAQAQEGVWKSEDSGRTWRSVSEGLPSFRGLFDPLGLRYSVADLELAPSNPDVIYASEFLSRDQELYRSRDGAETWERLTLPEEAFNTREFADFPTNQVNGIAIDPEDEDRLAVSTNQGRVLLSEDGGDSWEDLGHLFEEITLLDADTVAVVLPTGQRLTGPSPYSALGGLGNGAFPLEFAPDDPNLLYVPTSYGLYAVAVPEPAAGVLLGLAGTLLLRRRTRSRGCSGGASAFQLVSRRQSSAW